MDRKMFWWAIVDQYGYQIEYFRAGARSAERRFGGTMNLSPRASMEMARGRLTRHDSREEARDDGKERAEEAQRKLRTSTHPSRMRLDIEMLSANPDTSISEMWEACRESYDSADEAKFIEMAAEMEGANEA